jgi:hypothetical protein
LPWSLPHTFLDVCFVESLKKKKKKKKKTKKEEEASCLM